MSSYGHTTPNPGKQGYGVLARSALGVSTEVGKPRDEAREKSLTETLEGLIGKRTVEF